MEDVDLNNPEIIHNGDAQRWELHVGDRVAVASYRRRKDTLFFISTEVPRELEGQGIGSRLVKTVLDDAREKHLAVVPYCSFVAAYIRRHPEYSDLVPSTYHNLI
jgi:predicted GNAT family acetyltransferase